tara:strand:- start:12275 stop:12838 length:564 start_codon:yes stop_codon:yes gene_type:complete
MKKIIVIILVLCNVSLSGQRRNRGGQNNNAAKQQEAPKFDAAKRAGLFYYDIEEVVKKVLGKKENPLQKGKFLSALKKYNDKVKETASLNSKKISDLNAIVNSMSRGKIGDRTGLRKRINEVVGPIRGQIIDAEKDLNTSLKELLSEKQHSKWLKYQIKKKKSLAPKRPNRENRTNSRQGNRGGRRQ